MFKRFHRRKDKSSLSISISQTIPPEDEQKSDSEVEISQLSTASTKVKGLKYASKGMKSHGKDIFTGVLSAGKGVKNVSTNMGKEMVQGVKTAGKGVKNAGRGVVKVGQDVAGAAITTSKLLVADAESCCMLCDAVFSLRTLRHTCKVCGIPVCDECSKSRVVLRKRMKLDMLTEQIKRPGARVCDSCMATKGEDGFAVTSGTDFTEEKSSTHDNEPSEMSNLLEKPIEQKPVEVTRGMLDPWMHIYKLMGQKTRIGYLEIRILEAQDLPALDRNGKSDPYGVIKLGPRSHLKHDTSHVERVQTKVKPKTLNPKWNNADFVLGVENILDVIEITFFDHDFNSNDEKMGSLYIPLTDLSHSKLDRKFYSLTLDPQVEADYLKSNKDIPKPQVLLETCFLYSKAGELFSYYSEPAPFIPPPGEFSVKRSTRAFWRLLELLEPVTWFLGEVSLILSWSSSSDSWMWLLILSASCVYTWVFGLVVQILLITLILSKKATKRISEAENEVLGIVRVGAKKQSLKARMKNIRALVEKENQTHDSFLVQSTASLLTGNEVEALLKWLQEMIEYVNSNLEFVYDTFNWKDPVTTQGVLGLLMMTTMYTLFTQNFRHIMFVIVVYVMTMYTRPGIWFYTFVTGTVFYLTRPRHNVPRKQEDDIFQRPVGTMSQ